MASTLSLFEALVDRAHLEPRDAAVVAEAIRDTFMSADLVTKPYLELKLTELRGELGDLKSEILRHMYFALLGQMGVLTAMMYFFTSHAK